MNFKPFGAFLMLLIDVFNSYGWAILAFGLIVKIIMLPFQMKSKKSMMRTTMLQPRMKELEKRYGHNKQKYQEEVSKLYKEAKANPMSGCLWTLIPFPILIALYSVVRQPLTKLMNLSKEQIATLTDTVANMGLYTIPEKADAYSEMTIANIISENFDAIVNNGALAEFADKLHSINFEFIGLNMTAKPKLMFWNGADFSDPASWLPALGLFLIPFASAGLTMLQTKISQAMQSTAGNDAQAAQAAQTAKTMNMMMPLMSVYICFIMPAAMGIYWIEQSVLGIIQEAILNRHYKGKLDAEMAEFNEAQRKKDEELERKRQETARRKAEGTQGVNTNTSKKRLHAKERNDEEQRQAAQRAAERAAKGLDKDAPASQVGNRRFARGRAYMENRYDAPAEAETAEVVEAPVVETVETNDGSNE